MSEKLYEKKWLEAFVLRVCSLSKRKEPVVVRLGKERIFELEVGKLLTIDNGKLTVELGQSALKTKGNLIGMAGFYYNPKVFWGETVEKVALSWAWLMERLTLDEKRLEEEAILEFLSTGIEDGTLVALFSLAVDLYDLDSSIVDVSSKISELKSQVRAHLRRFEKLKLEDKVRSYVKIGYLRRYMADLSSECRLARLANEYGYDVKLGKHPDLTIDGKAIEVKRVRMRPLIYTSNKVKLASLTNPIKSGIRQRADMIAIQVNNLRKRKIRDFRTVWTASDTLRNALKTALAFRDEGRCVLLFCGTNKRYFGRLILLK